MRLEVTAERMTQNIKAQVVKAEALKAGAKLSPELLRQWQSNGDKRVGLCVPGKLRPKRIPGGIVLVDTTFQFKEG